jgi:hypothetical protein
MRVKKMNKKLLILTIGLEFIAMVSVTAVATPPPATADGPVNQILAIVQGIQTKVNTLLTNMAAVQTDVTTIKTTTDTINGKLDTVTCNTENAIIFYQNPAYLQPSGTSGDRIDYDVLEYEEGKTYHVHVTGIINTLDDVGIYLFASPSQYTSNTAYYQRGESESNFVNLDLVCTSFGITLVNYETEDSGAVVILTIQYQNSTSVVHMP